MACGWRLSVVFPRGSSPQAHDYATRSIKLYPNNIGMYTVLADIELRAGNQDKAVAAIEDGLKATARNPQLLWGLANVLIDVGKPKEAEKTIQELATADYPKQLIDYLKARNEFAQGHWLAARQGLEKVRGTLLLWPNLLKQVDVWIGQCYGQMGNRDLEAASYRRALNTDQFYTPARVGLMGVLQATGDVEAALTEYEQLAKLGKIGAGGLIPYARMLILHNLRQPAAKRNWDEASKVLDEAEKISPDAVQVPVLRAEILVAQDRLTDAETLLEEARIKNPGYAGLWTVLASLAQRQKNWTKAERTPGGSAKDNGATRCRNGWRWRNCWPQRHGEKATDRLRKLAENVDKFSDNDRLQLWAGLVGTAIQVGDTKQARQLCERIAAKEPYNVQVRFVLFEQAMRAEDDAGMEQALKEIERVAGSGAYWLYGQAVRLSLQAKGKKGAEHDQLLNEALDLLARAREARQNWSRIPLLMAGIYDEQGKLDLALKNYQEAIEMGEHDPAAVQRTIQLLFQKQQYGEADRLLRQLDQQQVPFSPDMNRASAEAALRQGDFDRALETARKSAASDSKRYQEQMWLGQMLSVIGRRAKAEGQTKKAEELLTEAEKALRRAVEIEPKLPATWVALIQFLSSCDKEDQAEKLIDEASKSIPAKQAPLAIAQCYEVMGKTDAAEGKYEAALAASPQDVLVLRAVADFYCRVGKAVPAEALLRRIVDGKVQAGDADMIWARRQLALIFSARGGYRNMQKARDLIEQNLAAAEASVADRRVKASLDAADPDHARRDEAIHTLETLLEDKSATPEDLFQLAQMYRSAGAWPQASTLFRKLVGSSGNEPRYLSVYITALMEHNEVSNAEAYLDRLETAIPNHINAVGLRAEVLVAKNEPDKALDLLKAFIDKRDARPPERNVRVRLVAEKLEQLAERLTKAGKKEAADRFVHQAEMLYRAYVDQNHGQELILVAFLGRQGRTDEALDVLNRIWDSSNPAVLSQVFSILLRNNKIGKEQMQRLDGILQSALKQFDRPIPLLMIYAELCSKQARYPVAEGCYREVIVKAPGNAYALNNLAVLLALQGIKLDEAMKLINQAVEIAGPVGAMLDSRATVYLALGETEKALADMADALADAETPVRLFHQAQAYDQAGKQSEAAAALEKALQKGLTKEMLHPLEIPAFERLKQLPRVD